MAKTFNSRWDNERNLQQAEKLKSREIKSWWWISDGSLDNDGCMNVCVCDVVSVVVCVVVFDVVCDVVRWNDWFYAVWVTIMVTDGQADERTDICTSRVAFATEKHLKLNLVNQDEQQINWGWKWWLRIFIKLRMWESHILVNNNIIKFAIFQVCD